MSGKNSHFILAPSDYYSWGPCPGSLYFKFGHGEKDKPEAIEGTFAHAVAAQCLETSSEVVEGLSVSFETSEGTEEREVPEDMVAPVQSYVDYCCSLPGDVTFIEERLDLSEVYNLSTEDKKVLISLGIDPEPKGTSDYIKYCVEDNVLYCVDLKYGRGIEVFAGKNKQGGIYCSGAYKFVTDILGLEISKIVFVIFQPRIKKEADIWEFKPSYLKGFDETVRIDAASACTVLKHISENTEVPSNYFNPGTKQCSFCPGAKGECEKGLCGHREAYLSAALDAEFDKVVSVETAIKRVQSLSDEELALRLPVLDMVTKLISSLWTEANRRLMLGAPGLHKHFKLVAGKKGNRKWKDEKLIDKELRRMKFKIDEMYKFTLQSPAVIEKVCAKKGSKIKWRKLSEHIDQTDGSLTIVPTDDKREDKTPVNIDDEFDKATAIAFVEDEKNAELRNSETCEVEAIGSLTETNNAETKEVSDLKEGTGEILEDDFEALLNG